MATTGAWIAVDICVSSLAEIRVPSCNCSTGVSDFVGALSHPLERCWGPFTYTRDASFNAFCPCCAAAVFTVLFAGAPYGSGSSNFCCVSLNGGTDPRLRDGDTAAGRCALQLES